MTYFEAVSVLEDIATKKVPDVTDIDKINNGELNLHGDRYVRFINQISYTISTRLANFKENIILKINTSYLDNDNLILSMSLLKDEIDFFNKLIKIKYVANDNYQNFISSMRSAVNDMLDEIADYFEDEDRINIVKSFYMEDK